jgi:hypothetical protein
MTAPLYCPNCQREVPPPSQTLDWVPGVSNYCVECYEGAEVRRGLRRVSAREKVRDLWETKVSQT